MKYALAKELKDAGFPQHIEKKGRTGFFSEGTKGEDYYVPTLEELVSAIGEDFDLLCFDARGSSDVRFGRGYRREEKWSASSWSRKSGFGNTPTEAVARLWLALN